MSITKGKIGQNSKVVTFGDPAHFSNSRSHREVNTQTKPQRPDGGKPQR